MTVVVARWLLLCLLVLMVLLPGMRAQQEDTNDDQCPNGCHGHGVCRFTDWTCSCDFGHDGEDCGEDWGSPFQVYLILFTVVFLTLGTAASLQLLRLICVDGCNFTHSGIQKILHMLFAVMGFGRVIWLQTDPHNLKKQLHAVIENLGNSLGVYIVVLSYFLVVMLWSGTYTRASMGKINSPVLRYVRPLLIGLMILFGLLEVLLRILWRIVEADSVAYAILISSYFVLILVTISTIMFGFLFYGLRLYNNLAEFEDVNVLVKERLKRITALTTATSMMCIITLVVLTCVYILEIYIFKFKSMSAFVAEQFIFRTLEVSLALVIMVFLGGQGCSSKKGNEDTPLLGSSPRTTPKRRDHQVESVDE